MTSTSEHSAAHESLRSLLDACLTMPRPQSTTIVGIDGRGGAGKSSLAEALAALDPSVTIVHIDDFYDPSSRRTEIGATIDWRRVVEEVLAPLRNDQPGRYQRFDWDNQRLEEWRDVPSGGIVILDGVYSTRRELADHLNCRIWVEVPRTIGMERGVARDGQASRSWWVDEWMPNEDRYVAEQHPGDSADVVIDGSVGAQLFEKGEYQPAS